MLLSPARYLFFTLGVAVCALAASALLVWRVDPLQHYRAAPGRGYFGEQPRWQNPGLARHADYDLALVGTSVSLGFDLADTAQMLGGRPLNLAMQGASIHEQCRLLRLALGSGRVRRIVWDWNYEFFRGAPNSVSSIDGAFPAFLYDDTPWNDCGGYLLNADLLRASARILLGRYPRRTLADLSVHRAVRPAGAESVAAAVARARQRGTVFRREAAAFAPGLTLRSFRENVWPLLQAHPEVQWDAHFPPLSLAYHALLREENPGAFADHLAWRRAVAAEVAALPQVRLHDFQGSAEIVGDLARYHDAVHCDAATHRWQLARLADASLLTTPARLDATEALLRAAR
jgi:hypothetical protein